MIDSRLVLGIVICLFVLGCAEDAAVTSEDMAENDRGVALMGRYEYADARRAFAAVVERSPDWLDARVNLAIATLNRQEEGDERLALDILGRVLNEDPDQLRAVYMAGLIHLYLGEPELAADFFGRVIAADPRDAYAAYFFGQSQLQADNAEVAATSLLRAIELDPYLRSAYWAGAQLLRRLGRVDEASSLLTDYQRLEPNPAARVAAFAYRRMGPKADALAVINVESATVPPPAGPLFAEPRVIDEREWNEPAVTTADIDGDGLQDLLVAARNRNAVFAGEADGTFEPVDNHPLAAADAVRAALWGDVDDDGLVDAVLCGPDGVQWWRQESEGDWTPNGISTQSCTAGALFDADHDGDLDIFVTGSGGNELLSNNRDGSFRMLADEFGLRGSPGRQVIVADLDADRDLDIIVVNASPPHDVWQNDRTWQYRPYPGLDELRNTPLLAVTVADANADGHPEIFAVTGDNELLAWHSDGTVWTRAVLQQSTWQDADAISKAELSVADFDGNGSPELLLTVSGTDRAGFSLIDTDSGNVLLNEDAGDLSSAIAAPLIPGSGPALIGVGTNSVSVWPAGSGRYPFLALTPTGRSEAEQMRSNASGIGTRVNIRIAGQWTVLDAIDPHSGAGQSLAPLSVGLRGHDEADFVALVWSDGVSQTEIGLAAGRLHEISETQRQLASCPVAFAWDGDSYEFVSDVLGVGGLGFFISPGVYAPPRPFESYLLDADSLVARDGKYIIKLTEPMEENAYLDAARIHVLDVPRDWSVVLDERMGVAGPEVTGRPITYRRALDPVRAISGNGNDVTDLVLTKDNQAPPPGKLDHRFIGLLAGDQTLTLEFEEPLDGDGLALVADGWIEYPYSQTVFAAWQADVSFRAATLEARGADGHWVPTIVEFGYPAGMPRKMVLPITDLPPGTDALRLSSNMEIYWDRLQVVWEESLDVAFQTTLEPSTARVARTGFAQRTTGPQRLPHYDYDDRSPYWDAKFQRGFYTAYGDATELVAEVDGALAIIGGGEEIHLEFPAVPPPAPGIKRYFALDFRGWAKDMDLYTEHGETVGPLPVLEGMDESQLVRRDRLHARYNVRFQEGL